LTESWNGSCGKLGTASAAIIERQYAALRVGSRCR
jgi:hypothetical protein